MLQVLLCQERELSKVFGDGELLLVFSCCSQLQFLSISTFSIPSIFYYDSPTKTGPLNKSELLDALSETSDKRN